MTGPEELESDDAALKGAVRALVRAAQFCDAPENRERLTETLAESKFIDAPIRAVRMSLSGMFDYGHGRMEKTGGQHIFFSEGANDPTPEKTQWVLDNLIRSGAVPDPTLIPPETLAGCFRQDLFQKALQHLTSPNDQRQ